MFEKLRADWKVSGEALDRSEAIRRRKARANKPAPSADVAIMNAATITGNDANSAVNG